MLSTATTPTKVYGYVYGCTRGVSHPVYDDAEGRNCSYTPSYKDSDGFLSAIWSCWQSVPPAHSPTIPAVASLSSPGAISLPLQPAPTDTGS